MTSFPVLPDSWYPPLCLEIGFDHALYPIHPAAVYGMSVVLSQPLDSYIVPGSCQFHIYVDGSGGVPATDTTPEMLPSWSFVVFSVLHDGTYIYHGASGGYVLAEAWYPLHVGASKATSATAELTALR